MTLPAAHSPRLTFPVRESTSPAKGSSEHRVPRCLFDSAHSHRSVLKKVVRYRGELRNIQAPQTRAAGSVSWKRASANVAGLRWASAKGPSSGPFHPFTLPSSTPTSFRFSCRAGRKYTMDLPSVTTFTKTGHRSHLPSTVPCTNPPYLSAQGIVYSPVIVSNQIQFEVLNSSSGLLGKAQTSFMRTGNLTQTPVSPPSMSSRHHLMLLQQAQPLSLSVHPCLEPNTSWGHPVSAFFLLFEHTFGLR